MNKEALWGLGCGAVVAVAYFLLCFLKKGRKEGEPKIPDVMMAAILGGALPAGGIMLYTAIYEICQQVKPSKLEATGGLFGLVVFLGGIVKIWDMFRPLVKPYFKKKRKATADDDEDNDSDSEPEEPAPSGPTPNPE